MGDQAIAAVSYTIQNKHKTGTTVPSVRFEPAIPESSGFRPTPQTTRPPGSAKM